MSNRVARVVLTHKVIYAVLSGFQSLMASGGAIFLSQIASIVRGGDTFIEIMTPHHCLLV